MLNRCWMLFLLFLLLGLKDLKHQILGDRRTWVPTDTWAFGASTFQSKVARAATQNPSNLSPGNLQKRLFFGDSFSMSWIMNWLWVGSYWCWDRHPLTPLSPLSPWLRFSHVLIDRSCGSDPCLGQQHHGDGDYPWWIRGTVHHHFSEQHLHPMCHLEVHGSTRVWIFGMNRPFELWWYCHV